MVASRASSSSGRAVPLSDPLHPNLTHLPSRLEQHRAEQERARKAGHSREGMGKEGQGKQSQAEEGRACTER